MNKYFNKVKLGELTDIIAGGDKPKIFSENKTSLNTVPVFANAEGNNGLQGYTNLPRIIEPAVTIAARGSKVGFAALRKQPFFPIVRLLTLIPKKNKLEADYLFYNLKLNRQNGTGSGQPQITIPEISEKIISVPPLLIQQKIAKVLSDLDAKIELNNKINVELEAMAKTIYDYWFVQFDFPFDFAQGRPDANGKPYKSSGGKMVWNEELKREIPEGWTDTKIGNISELIRGVSYDKTQIEESLDDENIRILRATNLSGNKIDLNNPVLISKKLVDEKQLLRKYDILLTMSSGSIDHIGKNGFYYFDEEVSFGAFCAKLIPYSNYSYYLYQFMQSEHLNKLIKNECLGTNINNLNSSMVKGFKLVNPDNEILKKFERINKSLFSKIEINTIENQHLASLRDWLLPMLMNGQVTVGDALRQAQDDELGMVAEDKIKYGN